MTSGASLPLGIRVIIGFHTLSFVLWIIGQTGAVLDYDRVAEWGLQDPRILLDPAIVEANRAIGLTDTIVMLPLYLVAVVGLLGRRFYGAVASWLVFGMSLYWPVMFWCSQAFYAEAAIEHAPTSMSAVVVPGATALIAAWGSWYLARRRAWFLSGIEDVSPETPQ
jgi:hypothetical protein